MFQRARSTQAGLRTIRLHDVRHTALTLMALHGVPLAVVAAWAGHADPAFTLRTYAHSQDDAMRDASSLLTRRFRRRCDPFVPLDSRVAVGLDVGANAQAADLRVYAFQSAAGVGFEPTNGFPLRAFKARAIGR